MTSNIYLGCDDEGIVYVHLRALVTLFDELLSEIFNETLADHLPSQMLPISTMPPEGIELLIDREFNAIKELLRPNRRHRAEARGKIRTLFAMEAHSGEDVEVSERDVNRVESGICRGQSIKVYSTPLAAWEEKFQQHRDVGLIT